MMGDRVDPQTGDAIAAIAAFGTLATQDVGPTVLAGRYIFQAEAERRILPDVLAKLHVEAHHRVLDIGCGAGALAIPLSFLADEVVAIDHPETVAAVRRRFHDERLSLVGGAFPGVSLDGTFDRIVAYSVVVCLPDLDAVTGFMLAAARLLRRGGRMLIGDLPNRGRQSRYRATAEGQAAETAWEEMKRAAAAAGGEHSAGIATLSVAHQIGGFTDDELCGLVMRMRREGYEAMLLDQPQDLPFGHTREDILVVRG